MFGGLEVLYIHWQASGLAFTSKHSHSLGAALLICSELPELLPVPSGAGHLALGQGTWSLAACSQLQHY